jgi:hypothetical protein
VIVAIAEDPSGANAEQAANTGGIFVVAALAIAAPASKMTHITFDRGIRKMVIELLKLSR